MKPKRICNILGNMCRKLKDLSHQVIGYFIQRRLFYYCSMWSKPVAHIHTHNLLPIMKLHLIKCLSHMTTQKPILHSAHTPS